jgi:hypothetical protein
MLSPIRVTTLIAGGLATAGLCFGQMAISTHSGLVQLTVGSVFLNDKPLHKTTTNMVEVKPGQVLRTGKDGNAEILLTPGVFMRLGNDTSVRMDANALSNTKVTVLSGSSMVECDELLSDNAISFTVGNHIVQLRKKGLFRLEADPPAVAAIKGEAFVADNINEPVKQGKLLQLDTDNPKPQKFHQNKDDLVAFSKARSEDSVYATGVTSSSLYSSGYGGCTNSSWYLMGGVGMYSYLPCNGMFTNPYGLYMLGLNNGYLWGGPSYYVAPYAVYGVPYGVGRVGTVAGGRTVNPAVLSSLVNGNGKNSTAVPVYGVGAQNATVQSILSRNAALSHATSAASMHTIAGPALGHSAAMGVSRSAGYAGVGSAGGGYRGGYAGVSPGVSSSAAHSVGMSSAGHAGGAAGGGHR